MCRTSLNSLGPVARREKSRIETRPGYHEVPHEDPGVEQTKADLPPRFPIFSLRIRGQCIDLRRCVEDHAGSEPEKRSPIVLVQMMPPCLFGHTAGFRPPGLSLQKPVGQGRQGSRQRVYIGGRLGVENGRSDADCEEDGDLEAPG